MSEDVFTSDALIQTNTGDFVLDSIHVSTQIHSNQCIRSNHYYEIESFARQCSYKGWSESKTCAALGINKYDIAVIRKVYENNFTICGSDDIFAESLTDDDEN